MAHLRRYVTRQDFDDAFEELYRTSPVPQLIKPLLSAFRSPVPQLVHGHGEGVGAIFDRMKRNTSMSSDLNTSCTTADTTLTRTSDNQQGDGPPKDKENLTPEKDSEEGMVTTERQLFSFPQSPAARASANFARHAALVDTDSPDVPESLVPRVTRSSTANLARSTLTSRLDEHDTAGSASIIQEARPDDERNFGRRRTTEEDAPADFLMSSSNVAGSCGETGTTWCSACGVERVRDTAVPGTSRCSCQSSLQPTDSVWSSVINQRQSAIRPVVVVSNHRSVRPGLESRVRPHGSESVRRSSSAVFEASEKPPELGSFSPPYQFGQTPNASVSSPEERSADQETLQLVSKLVQRLQSSNENNSDSDSFDEDGAEGNPHRQKRNTAAGVAVSVQQHPSRSGEATVNGGVFANSESASSKSERQNRNGHNNKVKNGDKNLQDSQEKETSDADNGPLTVNPCGPNKLPSKRKLQRVVTADSKRKKKTVHDHDTNSSEAELAIDSDKDDSDFQKSVPRSRTRQASARASEEDSRKLTTKAIVHREDIKQKAKSNAVAPRKKKNIIYDDDESDQDIVMAKPTRGKRQQPNTRGKVTSDTEDIGELVEVDAISQKSAGPVAPEQDVFSLNLSCEADNTEVESDAILFASKRTRSSAAAIKAPENSRESRSSSSTAPQPGKRKQMEEVSLPEKNNKTGSKKPLQLRSWSLQPVARFNGVRVEGKLPNTEYYWCSSVIMERVTNRKLKSNNGSIYTLVGNISVENTMHAGFSRDLAVHFRHGFPPKWKELIQTEMEASKNNLSTVMENSKNDAPANIVTEPKNAKDHAKQTVVHTPAVRKRNNQSLYHTPELQTKDAESSSSIWTPQGVVSRALEANQVRRTSRGRCVIPPLARWAGQYVERDTDGNVKIAFKSTAAEQHFAKMAEAEMNHALLQGKKRSSKPAASLFSFTNSPPSTTSSKMTSTSKSKKPHRQEKNSNASKNKSVHRQKDNHADVTTAHANQNSGDTGIAAAETENGLDEFAEVSVDDMEQEVMAIVNKSKETRRQKAARKRETCYSQTTSQTSHVKCLDRSFDLSDKDEQDAQRLHASKQNHHKSIDMPKKNLAGKSSAVDVTGSSLESSMGAGERNSLQDKQKRVKSAESTKDEAVGQKPGKKRGRPRKVDKRSPNVTENDSGNCDSQVRDRSKNSGKKRGRPRKVDRKPTKVTEQDSSSSDSQVLAHSEQSSTAEKESLELGRTTDSHSRLAHSRTTTQQGLAGGKSGNNKRSGARRKAVIEDSSDDEEEEVTVSSAQPDSSMAEFDVADTQKRRQGRPRKAHKPRTEEKGKKGQAKVPVSAQEDERPWSQLELQRLQDAREQVPSDHCQFWEEVSQWVGTRSAEECAAYCLRDIPEPKGKNKKKNATKGSGEAPTLQAKRGTLKRRQELRAILEHDEDSVQDDLFDATPFRARTKAKIPCVDFSKTDEEVFGRNPNFFTPRLDGSHKMGPHFSKTPVSSKKTPCISGAFSPWQEKGSTRRRAVDQYVFRIQKNRRQLTKTFPKKKDTKKQASQPETPPAMRLFSPRNSAGGLFKIAEVNSDEDDEEDSKDYYYSDAEN